MDKWEAEVGRMQAKSGELTRETPEAVTNGRAAAAGHEAAAITTAAPAEVVRALADIWARVLRVEKVGLDEDFFDLGGHSLLGVELVYEIEEQLDRVCTLTMLFRNPTVRSLAAELHAGGAGATEPVMLELVSGQGPAIYCICGVHLYQELAEELCPSYSMYGIFLPMEQEVFAAARRGRAMKSLSVEHMAGRYLELVREQQPHGPYLLLGFCFGGILAYEAAQQLRAAGEEVSLLVMLDSTVNGRSPRYKHRLAERWEQARARQVERLPDRVQRSLQGEEWMSETRRLERARNRIYLHATRKYQVKPYPSPTVLVKPEAASELRPRASSTLWGWEAFVSDLEVCEVPGTHQSHLQRGNAHMLARALRPHLERATQTATRR